MTGTYDQAARALLSRPMLLARTDPAEFAAVQAHQARLRRDFAERAGWRLVVGVEAARLFKHPAPGLLPRHRARSTSPGAEPFDPARWALCCLVLAVLEGTDRDAITALRLLEEVRVLAADGVLDGGLDPLDQDDRRRFVQSVRWIEDIAVLTRMDGDLDHFDQDQHVDVLWHIDRWLLHRVLAAETPPSLLPLPDTERFDRPYPSDAADQAALHRLWRRLLDDPVLYIDDLEDPERVMWQRRRRSIIDALGADYGLVVEERHEGVVIVDVETPTLTDLPFPTAGVEGHAALLVCDWLHRSGPATADAVIRFVEEQASVHGKGWLAHRPDRLARRAVMVLIGHGLARHRPDGTVTAQPAAARYQPSEPTIRGSRPAQETSS